MDENNVGLLVNYFTILFSKNDRTSTVQAAIDLLISGKFVFRETPHYLAAFLVVCGIKSNQKSSKKHLVCNYEYINTI